MRRRQFLASSLMSLAVSVLHIDRARAAANSRLRPGMPGWPTEPEWEALNRATNGRLSRVTMPTDAGSDPKRLLANPFFVGDQPGLTQSSGWLDAWRSSPSAYVVAAENAADVAAAVQFARTHNLRLVVKGGGHSYFGTSNAPDSLLLWTRKMNAIAVHDRFTPVGSTVAPVPAVSLGAGCIWLHAYQAVTGETRDVVSAFALAITAASGSAPVFKLDTWARCARTRGPRTECDQGTARDCTGDRRLLQ